MKGMLNSGDPQRFHIKGLAGSSASLLASAVTDDQLFDQIIILNDREEAAYFFNDMESFCPDQKILFFPSFRRRRAATGENDPAGMIQRTELLDLLTSKSEKITVVTYPEALFEKVIKSSDLAGRKLSLHKGASFTREYLLGFLEKNGFRETDFVYEPGEYAVRGSIIDLFSYAYDRPCRIDFSGDEIESLRFFDIDTQFSKQLIDSISVIPDIQGSETVNSSARCSLPALLDNKTIIWTYDLEFTISRFNDLYDDTAGAGENPGNPGPSRNHPGFYGSEEFISELTRFSIVEFGQSAYFKDSEVIQFNTAPQPAFHKNFELLALNLAENSEKGYTNYIFSGNEKQFERLRDIFREIYGSVPFTPVLAGIYRGFSDHDLRICCYTDHQIFERYHKFRIKENFIRKEQVMLRTLHDLQPGDYVVHIDHGIGKFGGLEKIEVNGKIQESLRLVYKDGDILYVSIHAMHRISKYKGGEGVPPKIYKLGTGAWQKLKQKTKSKVKDIARELIALYAKRRTERGFSFSADTYLQRELEASFLYEDTPDQLKSTNMVKGHMESAMPMDVLVCGDVGFGKTEVAIRAAFKAVTDNKQVAVLVPTTILALQHYNTFGDRLRDFPCRVEHISRLRPAAKQKEIISELAQGKIDILIGTHRIIGKDVVFKDMGLLIIDEEQKFGVSVKEKLKKMKLNVDTLTLTATPIPRTLQFSLMGARDLAIINTPPPNRHPIVTELHQFNREIIREAVEYEVQRGGQVFFIHNRIQNIKDLEHLVQQECPGIKVVTAHGQMESRNLENIMLGFIAGKFDVLISTTIIESGLDIPNANTIIINNAHQFGLSDLHQLRGRVGRSNKKAFCYLLAPPPQSLTREARQRLKAIEDFTDLGSGFSIAMQDLDIRGAGNLLGREQSGFIADIGFETYHRILDEAVRELREAEFSDVFSGKTEKEAVRAFINDCHVDTDLELLFPEEYVPGNTERIRLYRMLDNTTDEGSLAEFEANLADRFGPVPLQTRELINIVRLRRLAIMLGFEKILLKNGNMVIYLISNQMSPYYQSATFSGIINFVQKQRKIKVREDKNKLSLSLWNVHSVETALELLKKLSCEAGLMEN